MDPKNMTGEPLGFDSLSELNAEQFQNQEAGYVYRYRYNGGAASQVWLSHGRCGTSWELMLRLLMDVSTLNEMVAVGISADLGGF